MVNRINDNPGRTRDKLTQQDVAINYISETFSSKRSQPKYIDDLIVSLANAHENRRARQVTEWESIHQNSFRPTAL